MKQIINQYINRFLFKALSTYASTQ